MNSVRAFIGVPIAPTPALRRVLETLGTMGRPLRPVAAEGLHVTAKFLGDVPAESIVEIAAAMQSAAAGEEAFVARLQGLGAFPHADRPSVVWAGLQEAEPLVRIVGRLEVELESLGYPRESRPFHPHLTLARVKFKPPPELGQLLSAHAATEFGTETVDAVKLYRSETGPGGSRYTALATNALGT